MVAKTGLKQDGGEKVLRSLTKQLSSAKTNGGANAQSSPSHRFSRGVFNSQKCSYTLGKIIFVSNDISIKILNNPFILKKPHTLFEEVEFSLDLALQILWRLGGKLRMMRAHFLG